MAPTEATTINHMHPLYVGPSDTPGSVLIPVKLTGSENCGLWSRSMQITLLGKRKLGLVTGTCRKEKYKDDLAEQWETCNAIVLSWIMNTVAADLLGGIVYASDAHLVWEDLRERFNKVNRVRIFQLHKEIATLTQGTNSVSVYFSKLKELWHEFDVLVPLPGCDCVKSKDYKNHLQQQRIMQFLSGLNDSYDQARRQILMKSTAPTLNQAYAMIVPDESQQSMVAAAIVDKPEPMAMQAGRGQGFRGRKQLLYCDHCRMKGHTKESCYKIIGYPSDFKGKKRYSGPGSDNWKKESPAIANNVELGTVSQNSGDGAGPSEVRGNYFTDEQYRQILSMLKDPGEHHANMTGPLQWQGERDW